ncbi:HAD-like domain-containing protein [Stachybotrys elegans]|uniref:HAD-like domain-containing protein n=1 Tax=Stachybotrys elegans TaxID=80388 RepID=A0A8K0SWJ9_9HYPO|nr:HAD-like domain-containing protein [Stachybotrys elegans]
MGSKADFRPVRACIFDMDGLLLNTEDIYSQCANLVLAKYGKPDIPWSIKARLQGRPGPEANKLFNNWAQLPITNEEYAAEVSVHQRAFFPTAKPLPGVEALLAALESTKRAPAPGPRVHIALATSSHSKNFELKTTHLTDLFSVFPAERRVLGDDPRIAPGRGKPLPDIFLLALKSINDTLPEGEMPIEPEECLVFEDSVPGVEAGRRAGMRVLWCPHPMLAKEYAGREEEVLTGRTGEAGAVDLHQLGQLGDGWGQYLPTLENFPYDKYGIKVVQ